MDGSAVRTERVPYTEPPLGTITGRFTTFVPASHPLTDAEINEQLADVMARVPQLLTDSDEGLDIMERIAREGARITRRLKRSPDRRVQPSKPDTAEQPGM